jgi:hypothetical protein
LNGAVNFNTIMRASRTRGITDEPDHPVMAPIPSDGVATPLASNNDSLIVGSSREESSMHTEPNNNLLAL